MRFGGLLVFIAAMGISASPVTAGDLELVIGCSAAKKECVITRNLGGVTFIFKGAAKEVMDNGIHVRIDGLCASSCVIFASAARTNVCITHNAQMGLHRGTSTMVYGTFGNKVKFNSRKNIETYLDPPFGYRKEATFFTPDYGEDITTWAFEEEKMPYVGIYVMTHAEALKFWKPCP